MHRVAVLLLPPVVGFDAAIPSTLLGAAHDESGAPLYDVVTCGLSRGPVDSSSGFAMVPQCGPEALADADTVIVPGTRYAPARRDGVLPDEVRAALSTVPPGVRWVSICTGAFVLAAAGLLEGRRAATHWRFADNLRALHPTIDVDENVLFVDDGDVLTSAGLAAGIDLCLNIIRVDHGAQVANAVARYCVVPAWRQGGQAQFIERPLPVADNASTAPTRAWALHRLGAELTIDAMSRHAGMSPRTFIRRFRAETGQPPGTWVRERRLDHARELLERHDLSVDAVAAQAGFGTPANLRHHLRRELGLSPTGYRSLFQAS